MEAVRQADIVFSTAGHDKGGVFAVLKPGETRVMLVDGKRRKLDNPKEKSLKHIRSSGAASAGLAGAFKLGQATDRLIRRELAIFRSEFQG